MIPTKDWWYMRKTRDWKVTTTKETTTEHIKNTIAYIKRVWLRYHWVVRDYESLVQDYDEYYYDWPDKERDKEIIKLFEEELKLRWEKL
jgi:hypothetical protein